MQHASRFIQCKDDGEADPFGPSTLKQRGNSMGYLKRWTVATAGATVCLAGVVGVSTGLAGAAPEGDVLQHSTSAVEASAVPFSPGTYEWYVDGNPDGTITIASNNTFTSSVASDSGTWVQAGETFGLFVDGGGDAGAGCVFAGHAVSSTMVSYASKPGHWVCPGAHERHLLHCAGTARRERDADARRRLRTLGCGAHVRRKAPCRKVQVD